MQRIRNTNPYYTFQILFLWKKKKTMYNLSVWRIVVRKYIKVWSYKVDKNDNFDEVWILSQGVVCDTSMCLIMWFRHNSLK